MSSPRFTFPGGKRFAFTVLDDTDDGTVDNLAPIYALLEQLGMRTTKTIWPLACPEGSRDFAISQTLDDPAYRDFVLNLARRGFEITWHGATMESSPRERTLAALERFEEVFGHPPRIHVNHAANQENIYWGTDRIDSPLLRALIRRADGWGDGSFSGQVEGSPFWWGDLCRGRFTYARNLTTTDINTAAFNPSMPYRDPRRPLIPWWFSASDANDVLEFNRLLSSENQERLEREGGFCIVATHLGKRFVHNGQLDPTTRVRLEELASRNGWFPSVGELLDWLRRQRKQPPEAGRLPTMEWRRMQWRWAFDRGLRHIQSRR